MDARGPVTVLVYPVAPGGSNHEYLLLRRVPSRGGFWQGVTGGVETQETLDEAALRELQEETALTPSRLFPLGFSYTFVPKKAAASRGTPTPPVTEHVYLALLEAKVDPTLDPAEHDAWDWFAYPEARVWLRWPENVEALRRCENFIARVLLGPRR